MFALQQVKSTAGQVVSVFEIVTQMLAAPGRQRAAPAAWARVGSLYAAAIPETSGERGESGTDRIDH
jgi:hypothetical protein